MNAYQGDIYVGLGSNLEGPAEQVRVAVRELARLPRIRLCATSGLYRSPPMKEMDQPDYINAVVRIETDLEPEQLLLELQQIERQHGRKERHEPWASRTLDLDLLLWGQERRSNETLTLPHPGLHERAFVLAPLHELDKDLEVPGRGVVSQLLQQCRYSQVNRVGVCQSLPDPGQFIAVEGPIGVGKTTLCNRLAADFNGRLVLENFQDNPFLPDFFESPEKTALAAQLHFLTNRVCQLRQLNQADLFKQRTFADYVHEKSDWFSRISLHGDEYDLWLNVYTHMSIGLPRPDLVIYLQAPVPVLLDRIRARGRAFERGVRPEFLERLSELMAEHFRNYPGTVLAVDTSCANLATSRQDYHNVLNMLDGLTRPGQYFLDPGRLEGMPGNLAPASGLAPLLAGDGRP